MPVVFILSHAYGDDELVEIELMGTTCLITTILLQHRRLL